MKATLFLQIGFELGEPDDYPDEVASWQEAARFDFGQMQIGSSGLDISVLVTDVQVSGAKEFARDSACEEGE